MEQTKTLVALHNMDEEKIRRTLNLGAWPYPSNAVVQAAQGHTNYGEYSAVFPRSTIDPVDGNLFIQIRFGVKQTVNRINYLYVVIDAKA